MSMIEDLVAGLDDHLVVRNSDSTRIIIFNRANKRNAMSIEMRRAFASAMADAVADENVVAIIVTGAGGAFTAGLDSTELQDPMVPIAVRPHPAEAIRQATKPVIAAVDGICVTGGLELALSCSFIIASKSARFAETHAKIGAFPSWGQGAMLPRAIGVRRARQMAFTGMFVDASTANDWGLVNEIVAVEELLPRALEIAAAIAASDGESVRRQLAMLARTDGMPFAEALAIGDEEALRWFRDRNPGR